MPDILVIDTSYGSTVGVVGHDPIVETDSRTHVERLQTNIDRAMREAGLAPADLDAIIVGVGPAPFTGLRAGIVTAKALAFATGTKLVGQDILSPQTRWNLERHADADKESGRTVGSRRILTLAVNDARRKQLYFQLEQAPEHADGQSAVLIAMDIDYPERIVERVNEAVARLVDDEPGIEVVVDVVGHGAAKYAAALAGIETLGEVCDESVLDQGARGLELFAEVAAMTAGDGGGAGIAGAAEDSEEKPVEPLYLRRPDAEVPNPLKHVLGHAGATKER